ncbi:MAG: hypothetical protein KUG77_00200 [Nannocystaceae bacterium]|nr:hypothetical protein [Nannocystaceae bacterium]
MQLTLRRWGPSAALLLTTGCGTTSGDSDSVGESATEGIATAGQTGTQGTSGSAEASDTAQSDSASATGSTGAGTGSTGSVSDSTTSSGSTGVPGSDTEAESTGEQKCAAVSAEAELVPLPADIIFVVDNSGSMTFEAGEVQDRLNDFSMQIAASGLDAQVVLISSYPDEGNGICVDPPLGNGGCPDDDTNLPTYLHVDNRVGSHDAWEELLDTHADWSGSIREESSKHIVIVSDDDPNTSDDDFNTDFLALDPSYAGYFHHSVVSHSNCDTAASIGQDYIDLSMATGGVAADLCDQDFQAVFDALTTAILDGTEVACEFAIPKPPAGEVLDPDEVNVEIGSAMGPLDAIPRVDDVDGCGVVADGWYYDDPAEPTVIFLCPQTCESIQGMKDGVINIGFGCETILPG